MNTNVIREAKNEVKIKGELKGKEVKEITYGNNKEALTMTLEIEVGEHNIIPVELFVNKLKNNGEANGFYAGALTIANEYKEGDIVSVDFSAKLGNNDYYQNGVHRSRMQVNTSSARRVEGAALEEPNQAEFQLEGYIREMKMEEKDGEETGNMIVRILTPGYGGRLSVFDLLVENEEYIKQMESIYSIGDTVQFIGDIVNKTITEEIETEMAVGGTHVEVVNRYKQALVVTQGGFPYEEGLAYTEEQMQKAVKERENFLEELKRKSEEKKSGGGNAGMAFGGEAKKNTLENDIPF